MIYYQKVKIKNINFHDVVSSFHDLSFVKFLITFQPVKIIDWNGINNDDRAHFMFWFLGWKDFKVVHENYQKPTNTSFSFIDKGEVLPLGLRYWKHKHSVLYENNEVYIIDDINFEHKNIFGIFFYPILVAPIFLRKILYRLYFWYNFN
jgi:ligand-binding SRPBCC domain-containing protein